MGAGISRRDILKTLALSAVGGSVLQVIPAQAAEYAHQAVQKAKAAASGKYTDEKSGGAIEAGAPEFIDLLTSENEKYQLRLGGGLYWLDGFCTDRYNGTYLDCTPEQRKSVLDLIAFRKNAKGDPTLSQGVVFFAFVRNLTCDAFYTSKIGIADLQYIGNTALPEFPGCPPLAEA
jgi:gluconate 2-dehydrogenase gamma chain